MEEMSARFVNIDHDTPMLLPPDLRIAELREAKASEMQKSQGHCDQQPWDRFGAREWIY
jgi:hypothetical protein